MGEPNTEILAKKVIIERLMIDNINVVNNLCGAIKKEEPGELLGVVAHKVEIMIPEAARAHAEGVTEAKIATACLTTFKCGRGCLSPNTPLASYDARS
jgi:lipoprotein-anchoring transpeptidase ErfK/SrfK